MSKTPFQKVRSETRLIEKITMLVPGFRGYKLKELRREADKLVRDHLYRQLNLCKDDLKAIFQKLVDNKLNDVWTDMDRAVTSLDTVASEINHASYGYSGFFDAVKVNEKRLDSMLDFDSKMIDNVQNLYTRIKQFKFEVVNGRFENTRTYINEIQAMLTLLDTLYTDRTNIIHGV